MDKQLLLTCLILPLIDYIYLSLVSAKFNKQISMIQNKPLQLKIYPAIICYLSIIFSIYHFVILKGIKIQDAFLLGLTTYSIFDLTNKAIFDKWSWEIVIIDSLWGGILYSLTMYIVKSFTKI